VAAREVHDQGIAPELLQGQVEQADVAHGLGHLLGTHLHHAVVHPDAGERALAGGLGLRDLVLVVGEHQVRAPAVDLEVGPKDLLGHGGALDVPARAALAPG
jgi:hypothetical protein